MPSGESIVRQILTGKQYFKDKFGVEATTAMNVDSFGHSRGLVQILAQSGYDSYLIGRPGKTRGMEFDGEEFTWVGLDGSEIMVKRVRRGYGTRVDAAMPALEEWLKQTPPFTVETFCWGVGDHGGGASRQDLKALSRFLAKPHDGEIRHSTPEALFADLQAERASMPRFANELNPDFPGCYTSMVRVKQKHRRLENEIYSLEKMAMAGTCQGLQMYPAEALNQATRALMFSQFHDMLPGSGLQDVEEHTLQLLDFGLELTGREKARSFFALCAGQSPARQDNPPILVFNPHPFPVDELVECEFHLHDFNWRGTFFNAELFCRGRKTPCQIERARANATLDWAKRTVFPARLQPGMNRFDTKLEELKHKPPVMLKAEKGLIRFKSDELQVTVNTRTGLVDRLRIKGRDILAKHAFVPAVLEDHADAWSLMQPRQAGRVVGKFALLPAEAGTGFSAVPKALPSVRIIEDGPVRSVIEVVMGYGASRLCLQYKLPKQGSEFEVAVRVIWNETLKMLKLVVPLARPVERCVGQTMFGVQDAPVNGDEIVTQKWQAVISDSADRALTCIDDGVYGSDVTQGALRLTLLRSPSYSNQSPNATAPDRHNPVIDQGERCFRFWFNAGPVDDRLERIDREALVKNERPYALSFFPPGTGIKPKPFAVLTDKVIQMSAAKPSEKGKDVIVRLFNPTAQKRSSTLQLPWMPLAVAVELKPFALKTLRIGKDKKVVETDLLERPVNRGLTGLRDR
jgi:alpha-mannosidase